ncbi:uncharacterized protein LOC111008371 [Momordica charantia]|uniref:Uncharacterized protein LOC111008371 n=1 Tax=Momordica charantia TaxID=3673 RepID=A0A6J1C4C9_MOMCH|nr:uncharacterized protein LOC111008371 [Momordica charantia]
MADGYSKIKAACKFKSRSIDYSDLASLPHSLKFTAAVPNPNSLAHESDQNRANRARAQSCLPEEEEDEYGGGGGVAVAALSRNSSVSSSASGLHSAVKRALSMRRSSSVAERYCRIHDQFATLASPIDDEEIGAGDSKESRKSAGSVRRKKKNAAGKIVRACKRLFGL